MKLKRNLRESSAHIEAAIAKALSGAHLTPSELEEICHLSLSDLINDYNLDSLMAEKVIFHAKHEKSRQTFQSLQTWRPDSRDIKEEGGKTKFFKSDLDVLLEDITDMSMLDDDVVDKQVDGRMLDYGKIKSDSGEGQMMKQALYEIGEYSNLLHDMLSDEDDLPQWCHYKVAVARSSIGKVKHYLEYKIKNPSQK